MSRLRYFYARRPKTPEGGVWKVYDRQLDIRAASCDFKEQAILVCDALNSAQVTITNESAHLSTTDIIKRYRATSGGTPE